MSEVVRVAAGVLIDAAGQCLVAQRPAGKIAAGRWEFPGGKIEANESPQQALHRELHEELGIRVLDENPLIQIHHAYTDRVVHMWVYEVRAWSGTLVAHDGQALAWQSLETIDQIDLLGADGPVVQALRLPRQLPITRAGLSAAQLMEVAQQWQSAGHTLARLRQPQHDDTDYMRLATLLIRETGIGWILDRCPEQLADRGAKGFHLTQGALSGIQRRPLPPGLLCGASVHDQLSWRRARAVGCDYALLGPVQPTATHPGAPGLGWAEFSRCVEQGSMPTYALGGLGPDSVTEALNHWGQGVSGIRAYEPLLQSR